MTQEEINAKCEELKNRIEDAIAGVKTNEKGLWNKSEVIDAVSRVLNVYLFERDSKIRDRINDEVDTYLIKTCYVAYYCRLEDGVFAKTDFDIYYGNETELGCDYDLSVEYQPINTL